MVRQLSRTFRYCLLMLSLSLSGCGTTYLLQAARGQWQVLHQRQPVESLIASEGTDATLRRRLELVRNAREFASHELALPDNRSYRSFRALGRPYAVWNVVAAPEFSVAPHRWCFFIVGCLAYRGYFHEADARRYAAKLRAAGEDVMVGGVTAYSTLGRFADPVLDTMMRYGDLELAGTIFHELTHQKLYIKNDTEFNESLAVTVEREGLRRWLDAGGRLSELQAYLRQQQQQEDVVRILATTRRDLDALYRAEGAPETMRARKSEIVSGAGEAVRRFEREQQVRSGYDAWLDEGLNNAHLAAVGTYFDCVPAFERLLREQGGDLPAFFAAATRLGHRPAQERRQFCTPS
jgi:predicted aminopeptidase